MPYREVGELEQLTPEESAELWSVVNQAVVAIKAAYRPQGVNIGFNLGARPPAPVCRTTSTPTCCPAGTPTPTS